MQIPTPEAIRGDPTALPLQGTTVSMSSQVIHDDAITALGDEALTISTVTKYPRNALSDITNILSPHLDD
jgi:hypothetical protein